MLTLYGSRTGAHKRIRTTIYNARVAAFLLVRKEHWLFVLPASNTIALSTAALVLRDFGKPRTNMTNTSEFIFSRKYEKEDSDA